MKLATPEQPAEQTVSRFHEVVHDFAVAILIQQRRQCTQVTGRPPPQVPTFPAQETGQAVGVEVLLLLSPTRLPQHQWRKSRKKPANGLAVETGRFAQPVLHRSAVSAQYVTEDFLPDSRLSAASKEAGEVVQCDSQPTVVHMCAGRTLQ